MNKNRKAKKKMAPWLVTVLYFGCIALVVGGFYLVYRLTNNEVGENAIDTPKTLVVEEADGTQKTIVPGEEAFDENGYVLDENGEKVIDQNGNQSNILATWAKAFLNADVDPNDFGVDDEGYCYRPSTGERYKTPEGREFTAMDAKNGGFSD